MRKLILIFKELKRVVVARAWEGHGKGRWRGWCLPIARQLGREVPPNAEQRSGEL